MEWKISSPFWDPELKLRSLGFRPRLKQPVGKDDSVGTLASGTSPCMGKSVKETYPSSKVGDETDLYHHVGKVCLSHYEVYALRKTVTLKLLSYRTDGCTLCLCTRSIYWSHGSLGG